MNDQRHAPWETWTHTHTYTHIHTNTKTILCKNVTAFKPHVLLDVLNVTWRWNFHTNIKMTINLIKQILYGEEYKEFWVTFSVTLDVLTPSFSKSWIRNSTQIWHHLTSYDLFSALPCWTGNRTTALMSDKKTYRLSYTLLWIIKHASRVGYHSHLNQYWYRSPTVSFMVAYFNLSNSNLSWKKVQTSQILHSTCFV